MTKEFRHLLVSLENRNVQWIGVSSVSPFQLEAILPCISELILLK